MSSGEDTDRDRPEDAPGTLGGLLYADKAKKRVPESEWAELVRCIAAGDQRALHALFDRMHRMVFTLVVRITSDRETAEEVTLDVFHDVWRRAPTYDPANGTVIGWIMNQARSRAIDRLRFEQRKKRAGAAPDGPLEEPRGTNDPREHLVLRAQGRALHAALTALTPGEREAIESAYFSGWTYAEVAARLEQPLGTVKTRIRSALEKLRQSLAGEGWER